MIGVVSHQRWKIECYGKPGLAVRQQKLVTLIRVPCAPEPGELAHCPQAASVSRGVNASRVGIDARHAERLGASLGRIERRVDRPNFFFRVVKADVAQLTLFVLLAPFCDFFTEQPQFSALLFDRLYGDGKRGRASLFH